MVSKAQKFSAYLVIALFVIAAVVAGFGFAMLVVDVSQANLPLAVILSGIVTAAYAAVGAFVGHLIWGD